MQKAPARASASCTLRRVRRSTTSTRRVDERACWLALATSRLMPNTSHSRRSLRYRTCINCDSFRCTANRLPLAATPRLSHSSLACQLAPPPQLQRAMWAARQAAAARHLDSSMRQRRQPCCYAQTWRHEVWIYPTSTSSCSMTRRRIQRSSPTAPDARLVRDAVAEQWCC